MDMIMNGAIDFDRKYIDQGRWDFVERAAKVLADNYCASCRKSGIEVAFYDYSKVVEAIRKIDFSKPCDVVDLHDMTMLMELKNDRFHMTLMD